MIGWKFGNNFNKYLSSGNTHKGATPEELRKDWEKYGGAWNSLIYSCISFEKVQLLNESELLPKCRYRRGIIENK